jgi:hypothetical protein
MSEAEPTPGLLDALDRVRDVRGSLGIFDALVADDPVRVADALASAPRHPLRPRLEAWLVSRGVAPPSEEGPAAALARHGIVDVDAFVAAAHGREAGLVRALADTRAERDLALRSANAYALVAALLAMIVVGGWIASLAGFTFTEEPPSFPAPARQAAPSEDP